MNNEVYNSVFQKEICDFIELKRALGFSYQQRQVLCGVLMLFYVKTTFLKNASRKSYANFGVEKELMKL